MTDRFFWHVLAGGEIDRCTESNLGIYIEIILEDARHMPLVVYRK